MEQNEFSIADRVFGGSSGRIFIVAEVGINHGGKVEEARKCIEAAAECGADAVKFQTFRADRLLIPVRERYAQQEDGAESAYEMFQRLELGFEAWHELKVHADRCGILFLSTPFDEESVDLLDELDVPAFKIASADITHFPLIRKVAGKGRPVLLSTGMSYLAEVEEAVQVLRQAGASKILLMHCTSLYPALPDTLNLRAISTLRDYFGLPVGYSDHTQGNQFPQIAAALGATLIEKHFTLDRNAPGPDHKLSMDPRELCELVRDLRHIAVSLGDGWKRPTDFEMRSRIQSRRSIVAASAIPAGAIIREEMLTFKRPGTGLEPRQYEQVLGRIACRDIPIDTILHWEDLAAPAVREAVPGLSTQNSPGESGSRIPESLKDKGHE